MKLKSSLIGAASAAIVVIGLIPILHADEWNKRTLVTISEPIIAGNKVLQPGTYVWKLMDSASNRNTIRIYNESESKLLKPPSWRFRITAFDRLAKPSLPTGKRRRAFLKAVRAWFYPGDNYGQELPYPKKLVAQLASAQPTPIPTAYNPPPAATPEPAPAAAPQRNPPKSPLLSLLLNPRPSRQRSQLVSNKRNRLLRRSPGACQKRPVMGLWLVC